MRAGPTFPILLQEENPTRVVKDDILFDLSSITVSHPIHKAETSLDPVYEIPKNQLDPTYALGDVRFGNDKGFTRKKTAIPTPVQIEESNLDVLNEVYNF